jgi:hypothetical protein
MVVRRETYPLLEIGMSVCQDRIILDRPDLAVAINSVLALRLGVAFRLLVIADHEIDVVASFGFDRLGADPGGLQLWTTEVSADGAEHTSDVHPPERWWRRGELQLRLLGTRG